MLLGQIGVVLGVVGLDAWPYWPKIYSKVELGHQTEKRSLGLTGRMA